MQQQTKSQASNNPAKHTPKKKTMKIVSAQNSGRNNRTNLTDQNS